MKYCWSIVKVPTYFKTNHGYLGFFALNDADPICAVPTEACDRQPTFVVEDCAHGADHATILHWKHAVGASLRLNLIRPDVGMMLPLDAPRWEHHSITCQVLKALTWCLQDGYIIHLQRHKYLGSTTCYPARPAKPSIQKQWYPDSKSLPRGDQEMHVHASWNCGSLLLLSAGNLARPLPKPCKSPHRLANCKTCQIPASTGQWHWPSWTEMN